MSLVDDWENGASSESGQVLKGLIDKAASELSEGVEINERGDTVFIPYMGSNFRLVLKAEEDANLMVNGVVEGVTIASQSSSRSMEPFAEVVVESDRKCQEVYRNIFIWMCIDRRYRQVELYWFSVRILLAFQVSWRSIQMLYAICSLCRWGTWINYVARR